LVLLSCLTESTSAQTTRHSGTTELAFFGGGVFGIGKHPTVGGNVGAVLTERFLLLGELSYSSLGSDTFGDLNLAESIIRSDGTTFSLNGTTHFELRSQSKTRPFLAAGFGTLRSADTLTNRRFGQEFTSQRSNWKPVFNAGFGFRHYLTDHLGIRPELSFVIGEDWFLRLSIAFFGHIPPR
jgi:hypothetical protein